MRVRRSIVAFLVLLFVVVTPATADECRFYCKKISLDVAHCYEYLTGNKGTMYSCEEVGWCWPSLVDPIYCEAGCEGPQCYWV